MTENGKPDTRERIEADAGELVADYASSGSVCDELYDGILGLLDRQAALTEREWDSATANERIAELQAKLDHATEDAELYRVNMMAQTERVAELQAELDALRPPCTVEFVELESDEPPYDELLRCLENDWHISASWDGLRRFWNIELTEEGVRLRDAVPDVHDDTRDSWERICADLRAMAADKPDSAGRRAVRGGYAPRRYSGADREDGEIMSGIQALEKLRQRCWCRGQGEATALQAWKVSELLDEAEDEIAERFMELPVDADGAPIRMGDAVEGKLLDDTTVRGTVCAFHLYDDEPDSVYVHVDVDGGWTIKDLRLTHCRHVEPRTVEDVLSEFASRVLNSGHQWGLDAPDVVPEFAAEIRELMEVDE